MDPIKPSSLVYGTNLIARYLSYFLVPYGQAYKFDPEQANRPRPLSILIILLCFTPLLFIAISQQVVLLLLPSVDKQSDVYQSIVASLFIARLAKILRIYRAIVMVSSTIIVLSQHGRISNAIASGNNYISDKEQAHYAKVSLMFYFLNVFSNTIAYSTVFMFLSNEQDTKGALFYMALVLLSSLLFWTRLTNCFPLIMTCYLASALGRHVENFSTIYIDTMFDQFMKAIEKEGEEIGDHDHNHNHHVSQLRSLPFFDSSCIDDGSSMETLKSPGDRRANKKTGKNGHHSPSQADPILSRIWSFLVRRSIICLHNRIRIIISRLCMRRYPELPEMKMTKLSSTTKIQISDKTRKANNHLIRVRLRRTQIMLSELRDLVSDINKLSSPIVLLYLIFETMFIILVTTASVQAKVYKSMNILILPTISVTISLASYVVYVCICYDETTKQLRLLVNKLFDFIIMNHRLQSSSHQHRQQQTTTTTTTDTKSQTGDGVDYDPEQVCMLPGSEVGAINETWSQFQYTRKLANTIEFTLAGVVPITRRLVLSVLGHVLSAVFISIEIMSIIDTMNAPNSLAAPSNPMGQNSTGNSSLASRHDDWHSNHH